MVVMILNLQSSGPLCCHFRHIYSCKTNGATTGEQVEVNRVVVALKEEAIHDTINSQTGST